jgi:hypothetical protein
MIVTPLSVARQMDYTFLMCLSLFTIVGYQSGDGGVQLETPQQALDIRVTIDDGGGKVIDVVQRLLQYHASLASIDPKCFTIRFSKPVSAFFSLSCSPHHKIWFIFTFQLKSCFMV